jgi:hypothetical protein
VQVVWTQNVSRHMLLSKSGGKYNLELFSLPCAFGATTSECAGISTELAQEIQESYAMLFNAWHITPLHVSLGALFGIRTLCWCWSCSAHRYCRECIAQCRRSASDRTRWKPRSVKDVTQTEFDPLLAELSKKPAEYDWTPDDFPHLWSRIIRLEQHLHTSRPWSLWILFRDRRDTVQFWTFL